MLDLCDMKSYDQDKDGVISLEEIYDIFGDAELPQIYFMASDTNGGKITFVLF